jgi:hypothetical protein
MLRQLRTALRTGIVTEPAPPDADLERPVLLRERPVAGAQAPLRPL